MGGKSAAFGQMAAALCCDAAKPRDRIVATARELFHRHGIRGIGVDAIAEAAGTNKMTLYRHFGSKDELVVECLRRVAELGLERWLQLAADFPGDPTGRLRGWVGQAADWLASDGRGCDLANAAIELTEADHPARRVIEQCTAVHRTRLAELCAAAGVAQAELLADTLWLLLEGARVSRQTVGAEGPSAKFARMADAVITAFAGAGTAPEPAAGAPAWGIGPSAAFRT